MSEPQASEPVDTVSSAPRSGDSQTSDYRRIRVLWPDHLGLARGKYLPSRLAANGTGHCTAVYALGYDRQMTPAPGSFMLEGFPDMHARFSLGDVRPGWEPDTGVVVADLEKDGRPFEVSARHALRRAVADWRALGYEPQVGIELEAYLFEPDGHGGWKPIDTPGGHVYGTGRAVDPTGFLDELMETADRVGLPVESINSEYDVPQFELTLEYRDALGAVDDVFLFKLLAREVAHNHGLLATFLGRPLADRGGSGTHVNLSLLDGDGANALVDPATDDGLSTLAKGCLAGLCLHHPGMTALCAPTVNSYKRLRPGQLSGYWANWGHDHRCTANRVPPVRGPGTRIENRLSDGAANPYIATATVLQAARLGFVSGLEPPPPESGNGLDEINTDVCCAANLSAALDDLEADTELTAAVGQLLVDNFVAIKRAEWDRYSAAVTDWEAPRVPPLPLILMATASRPNGCDCGSSAVT